MTTLKVLPHFQLEKIKSKRSVKYSLLLVKDVKFLMGFPLDYKIASCTCNVRVGYILVFISPSGRSLHHLLDDQLVRYLNRRTRPLTFIRSKFVHRKAFPMDLRTTRVSPKQFRPSLPVAVLSLIPNEHTAVRRSTRIAERRQGSLGSLRILPCEILAHIMSLLPVRTLAQLALVSTGWRQFLQDWITLQSTAWTLAPARHYSKPCLRFLDEYFDLGILCRRLFTTPTLSARVQAFWFLLERVEGASLFYGPVDYDPTFAGACNFIKAAVALNCCRSPSERFETLWQIMRDFVGVGYEVLDGVPGLQPVEETNLRLALRVMFLSPMAPPRRVRLARLSRGSLLRALMCKLDVARQARLLFTIYGPRSGCNIDWLRPTNASFATLSQMLHIVGELGFAIKILARISPPDFTYNLVRHLINTPSPWLPRYEVMLLLTMGARATGAFLAGHAARASPHQSSYVATRLAQMASLSQLYKSKIEFGEVVSRLFYAAASINILDVFIYLTQFLPTTNNIFELVDDVVAQSFFLAFNVGGIEFSCGVVDMLKPVLEYFRGRRSQQMLVHRPMRT